MPLNGTEQAVARLADLTPRQIVAELDRFIVGQHKAKRAVAIALRNRWRRQRAPEELRDEIAPNNIILIGPTGVGKTEIARRLSKLTGAPFVKVEASKFTEVGYVGRDVESMVRDLVENAIRLVRSEREAVVRAQADELVENALLDILLPPPAELHTAPAADKGTTGITEETAGVFEVSATGSVTRGAPPASEAEERYQRTREKLRKLLKDGQLEDREVEVRVSQAPPQFPGMTVESGAEDMSGIGDWLTRFMPKQTKARKVTVSEARRILAEERVDQLIDQEELTADAVARAEKLGIIFLDEIDKIAGERSKAGGPDVSREGVQRDLLPIVEGSTVKTKYGMVRTDHMLFIAAGAFHVSKPGDLIPELQGRFPIRVELESLTEQDFVRIMTEPENSLTRQYAALIEAENSTLEFTDDGVAAVAHVAARVNEQLENIGARRLHTVLSTLLEDVMFDLPAASHQLIRADGEMVRSKLNSILEDEDLRKYML